MHLKKCLFRYCFRYLSDLLEQASTMFLLCAGLWRESKKRRKKENVEKVGKIR